MVISSTLLIKTYVTRIMLFCFMSDMLCWFANGDNQHLVIEFYKHKKTILEIAIILFQSIICLVPAVIS